VTLIAWGFLIWVAILNGRVEDLETRVRQLQHGNDEWAETCRDLALKLKRARRRRRA
jgi:hypothetical protein